MHAPCIASAEPVSPHPITRASSRSSILGHPGRSFLVAASLFILFCHSAPGQWDPAIWPACDHPRDARAQFSQVYSGILERFVIAIGPEWAPAAPTFYRGFRAFLADAKDQMHPDVDNRYFWSYDSDSAWVDTNLAAGGIFDAWYATNSANPLLQWTNVCARHNLPTNYFDFTPYWGELTGLGGHTDEVAVIGHAHGWTNEYTAAGGPYLPPGRTRWYTTDYGIDQMKTILGEFTWRVGLPFWGYGQCVTQAYGNGYSHVSWADAATACQANYVTQRWYSANGNAAYGYCETNEWGWVWDWTAYARAVQWEWELTAAYRITNKTCSLDCYVRGSFPPGGSYSTNAVWYDNGVSIVHSNAWACSWSTNSMLIPRYMNSSVLGCLSFPAACTAPTPASPWQWNGFQIDLFSGGGVWGRFISKWTLLYL